MDVARQFPTPQQQPIPPIKPPDQTVYPVGIASTLAIGEAIADNLTWFDGLYAWLIEQGCPEDQLYDLPSDDSLHDWLIEWRVSVHLGHHAAFPFELPCFPPEEDAAWTDTAWFRALRASLIERGVSEIGLSHLSDDFYAWMTDRGMTETFMEEFLPHRVIDGWIMPEPPTDDQPRQQWDNGEDHRPESPLQSPEPSWQSRAALRSNLFNAMLALREAPELREAFAYDEMARSMLLMKPSAYHDLQGLEGLAGADLMPRSSSSSPGAAS